MPPLISNVRLYKEATFQRTHFRPMKKHLLFCTFLFASTAGFSFNCFDSPEYKQNRERYSASNGERSAQLGKAVGFLEKTKGLNFNQALAEITRFSSPETLAFDNKLKEVADKIRSVKPQTPEECNELIKLQKQYQSIGKEKIDFIVFTFTGQ